MQTVLIEKANENHLRHHIDPVIDLVQVARTLTVNILLANEGNFVCIGELYNRIRPPFSYVKYQYLLGKDLEELSFGLRFERLGEYCRFKNPYKRGYYTQI